MSTDKSDTDFLEIQRDIEILESIREELDELEDVANDIVRVFHNIVDRLHEVIDDKDDALAWSVAILSNTILGILYRKKFANDNIPSEVIRYVYMLLFNETVFKDFMRNLEKFTNMLNSMDKYR